MKTKVYVVSLGGFDTHSAQCDPDNHEIGTHADLWQSVSDAIAGFQTAIEQSGNGKRVLGMTFSEFGRRIKANDSTGTDHGSAAPLFLFGNCVKPGILGNNPTISANVGNDEGVAMQYDFRSIYTTILTDWFELSTSLVKDLLVEDFQKLPIIEGCTATGTELNGNDFEFSFETYPNPADQNLNIRFYSTGEYIRISMFDQLGSEVRLIHNGQVGEGNHQMEFGINDLKPGNYFIRIASDKSQNTKLMVKM